MHVLATVDVLGNQKVMIVKKKILTKFVQCPILPTGRPERNLPVMEEKIFKCAILGEPLVDK